jgi:D-beta-D-heptose 7-phosphate kinase/D-beta-D-heptose 1-phosphate adenosyltransferase
MNNAETLTRFVRSFSRLRVIAIGDVILDRYWWGDANRLSPEAPVPVLLKRRVSLLPGGAGNSAANAAALGASVSLIGVIGVDREAEELCAAITERGIAAAGLIACHDRPTTTKTRLIAGHQQLLRVDEEHTTAVDGDLSGRILARFRQELDNADLVIASDYAKGLLTSELLTQVISTAALLRRPIFIDPKGEDVSRYSGATYLKPNRRELGILVGQSLNDHEQTLRAGRELVRRLSGSNLLVTEAGDGMSFFGADGSELHTPSHARQVFDITGAGDTVISAFALAVASGASVFQAMTIANVAAEITISKLGAATVTPDELIEALTRLHET